MLTLSIDGANRTYAGCAAGGQKAAAAKPEHQTSASASASSMAKSQRMRNYVQKSPSGSAAFGLDDWSSSPSSLSASNGGGHYNNWGCSVFNYTVDPRVVQIKPLRSFASGGRMMTVHGTNLDAIQKPEIEVSVKQITALIDHTRFCNSKSNWKSRTSRQSLDGTSFKTYKISR